MPARTAKKAAKGSPLKKKPEDRVQPYFCRFYIRHIEMVKVLAKKRKLPEAEVIRLAIESLYAQETKQKESGN